MAGPSHDNSHSPGPGLREERISCESCDTQLGYCQHLVTVQKKLDSHVCLVRCVELTTCHGHTGTFGFLHSDGCCDSAGEKRTRSRSGRV